MNKQTAIAVSGTAAVGVISVATVKSNLVGTKMCFSAPAALMIYTSTIVVADRVDEDLTFQAVGNLLQKMAETSAFHGQPSLARAFQVRAAMRGYSKAPWLSETIDQLLFSEVGVTTDDVETLVAESTIALMSDLTVKTPGYQTLFTTYVDILALVKQATAESINKVYDAVHKTATKLELLDIGGVKYNLLTIKSQHDILDGTFDEIITERHVDGIVVSDHLPDLPAAIATEKTGNGADVGDNATAD